ncbi:hypothetical protein PIB30_100504 [Stylosanthes scabra]|uniref:Uncharacterized protein n=1 Tax=Stylosanthes scabra TaxID=79078 RepID=A0ABU6UW30_9FABA|nr:hypothetical protein [Stylosanthes scabra]
MTSSGGGEAAATTAEEHGLRHRDPYIQSPPQSWWNSTNFKEHAGGGDSERGRAVPRLELQHCNIAQQQGSGIALLLCP